MSSPAPSARCRYRFAAFVLSPARRQLLRDGVEVPLIPRYLDLLLMLVERRREAVTRREILEQVWSDVVVSDGALSQAVRSLRRALEDDSREPQFIRTVSRHGYRFVFEGVQEESDEQPLAPAPVAPEPHAADEFEPLLARLLAPGNGEEADEDRRVAAEALHVLGTAEALERLDARPGQAAARALLRDARWDVPGAGDVPLFGQPGAPAAVAALVALRLRRALRLAGSRAGAASAGGALAGAVGGVLGGCALVLAPTSAVPPSVPVTLGCVGLAVGAVGAAGVGAGLAAAEALARSFRDAALALFGALGGAAVGAVAHRLMRWGLQGVFGQDVPHIGGGFEGLLLGAGAGLAYALAIPRPGGGMPTPHGRLRWKAVLGTGLGTALAALLVTGADGHLCAVSLNAVARQFQGSQVGLTPLARLVGEREMGPITRSVLGAGEGLVFGIGLAAGLTRRPRA